MHINVDKQFRSMETGGIPISLRNTLTPENGIRLKELLEKFEYADTMRKINNQ